MESMPEMRLPPTFPVGADPFTYRRREVQHQLRQSAFIHVLAVSNGDCPDQPIPCPRRGPEGGMIGIHVFEKPHRFRVRMAHGGACAANVADRLCADLRLRWQLVPDDFAAAPGREPPPVHLDPGRRQRFTMLDAVFSLGPGGEHRFDGFGTGQTFPVVVGGEPRLRLGAIGNILGGDGAFAGVRGSYVISGFIRPLGGVFLNMLFRVMDPDGRLRSESDLEPVESIGDPDPGATFLTLVGEPDPSRPVEQRLGPDGSFVGARVHERLRTVELDWDLGRCGRRLRTRQADGPVVGRLSTDLLFNPMAPGRDGGPLAPVPFLTRHTELVLEDGRGGVLGSLSPDIVEGRGFAMELPGAPLPAWRLVGFGPIAGGTGVFAGAQGMLSVNSAISVLPPAFSNVYVLRLIDPDGRFRARA